MTNDSSPTDRHRVYGLTAEVNVFDGKEKRACIALVHEYGSPSRNIPER
ncbi:hypothetical protein [Methanosarcina acetivorans]|nr:hypothetical protein [Methanosarcina acetivorans]